MFISAANALTSYTRNSGSGDRASMESWRPPPLHCVSTAATTRSDSVSDQRSQEEGHAGLSQLLSQWSFRPQTQHSGASLPLPDLTAHTLLHRTIGRRAFSRTRAVHDVLQLRPQFPSSIQMTIRTSLYLREVRPRPPTPHSSTLHQPREHCHRGGSLKHWRRPQVVTSRHAYATSIEAVESFPHSPFSPLPHCCPPSLIDPSRSAGSLRYHASIMR